MGEYQGPIQRLQNTEHALNLNPSLRKKVYHPFKFDQQLATDQTFRDSIAGFTTLPVGLFKQGIQPDTYMVMPWGSETRSQHRGKPYVNIDLPVHIARGLSQGAKRIMDDEPFPTELFRNRHHQQGVQLDLYQEHVGSIDAYAYDLIANDGIAGLSDWYRVVQNMDPDEIIMSIPNIHPDTISDEVVILSTSQALQERFSGKEFVAYMHALTQRKGIQLVYGTPERFMEFIEGQEYLPVDDTGVTIYQAIPEELLLGVVPLGPHEQSLLR